MAFAGGRPNPPAAAAPNASAWPISRVTQFVGVDAGSTPRMNFAQVRRCGVDPRTAQRRSSSFALCAAWMDPVLHAGRLERSGCLVERFGARGPGHAQADESIEPDVIERAAVQQHAITDPAM